MGLQNQTSKSACGAEKDSRTSSVLSEIYEAIREIRHGSVQIHIQDGKVVQIDKLSKSRIR
ncbi:MAG: DUF2292 domain-containing protein [Proteobacteria bacterium]|nr:DUF2292 domain-containing protein [Pseudomonadota bacterium]NIS68413.1 DUF2292 domain-containing protein [Pseudomonadota bacterium]